jgi:aspartate/methionine/tyrosine aminotransferase
VARALGCTVTPWPLEHDGAGWRLDLDALERTLTPRTRLLVINFPHNPTGYLPTANELSAVLRVAIRHSLFVFSDEMYRLLEYDPTDRLPSVADLYERGLALSGISKSFALPGLRIGWLVARDRELLRRCTAFHDYTTICNSAPSEILAIMALRAKERILARNLDIIRTNLAAAERFFGAHADLFTWLPPRAGSVAFPRLRIDLPVANFCQDVLAKKSVMIVPGGMFGHAGNHFRVGLGRTTFREALAQIESYLADSSLIHPRIRRIRSVIPWTSKRRSRTMLVHS